MLDPWYFSKTRRHRLLVSRQGAIGQRGDQQGRAEGASVRTCCPIQEGDRPTSTSKKPFKQIYAKAKRKFTKKKKEGTYDGNDDLTDQLIVELGVQLACVLSTVTNRDKSGYETKRKKPRGNN